MNIDNAKVIEFLSLTNPDLIADWNKHVGIESLRQLAQDYGIKVVEPEPEKPEYPLIDERFVFEFIESIVYLAEDDVEDDSIHRHSDFWQSKSAREQAKHFANVWFDTRQFREEGFGLMFNYNEFKAEKNDEFKARGGRDWYTPERQNLGAWK